MLIIFISSSVENTFCSAEDWISITNKNPSNQINLDLNFAWKICKHVKSNAIVIAKDQKTIGIGAGQMNRVGAAKIALKALNVNTKIIYNNKKIDGTPRKILDISYSKKNGWKPKYKLIDSIKKTYEDYLNQEV